MTSQNSKTDADKNVIFQNLNGEEWHVHYKRAQSYLIGAIKLINTFEKWTFSPFSDPEFLLAQMFLTLYSELFVHFFSKKEEKVLL